MKNEHLGNLRDLIRVYNLSMKCLRDILKYTTKVEMFFFDFLYISLIADWFCGIQDCNKKKLCE